MIRLTDSMMVPGGWGITVLYHVCSVAPIRSLIYWKPNVMHEHET